MLLRSNEPLRCPGAAAKERLHFGTQVRSNDSESKPPGMAGWLAGYSDVPLDMSHDV